MPYLIQYHGNWADEFDVRFATILRYADFNLIAKLIKQFPKNDYEYYFGTNESVIFDLSMDAFKVTEISDMDALTLSYYKLHNNGLFESVFEYLAFQLPDESEELELLMNLKLG